MTFLDTPAPPGQSPFLPGVVPDVDIRIVEPDPAWPSWYDELAGRVRGALGDRVLELDHVGSTSVPGLPAKPVIDLSLTVADPDDEDSYVPPLEAAGFRLRVREPWWYRHRMLRGEDPRANLHVWGPDCPEVIRQRLFRDHLIRHEADRDLYARAKREAAEASTALGEQVQEYNARKQAVVREIYRRAFLDAGLLEA